jgi:hypothetical protein
MARRKSRIQRRFRVHALGVHPFCRWCLCPLTQDSATTDHLVPLSRGGSNDWDNLCLACAKCNQQRDNRLPDESAIPRYQVQHSQTARKAVRPWVAWTRYSGGRWRRTFLGNRPDILLAQAQSLVGVTGETVILRNGEEPTATPAAAQAYPGLRRCNPA